MVLILNSYLVLFIVMFKAGGYTKTTECSKSGGVITQPEATVPGSHTKCYAFLPHLPWKSQGPAATADLDGEISSTGKR